MKTKNEIKIQRTKIFIVVLFSLLIACFLYLKYITQNIDKSNTFEQQIIKTKQMKTIATNFGTSLDNDDFETTKMLLSVDCEYFIGDTTLTGPEAIAGSYEANMIEGRNKMDKLEWGKSEIETISDTEYFVHFTDYLTHKGETYIHRCKQKVSVNDDGKIFKIVHISNAEEQQKLKAFYKRVGIKTK
ncbi:MAG: hypothetical protein AB8G11_06110 [Saprospiraceae bacterium]